MSDQPQAQTPSTVIAHGRMRYAIDGDELVITLSKADGSTIAVRVPAAKLERWAMRTMREEAFA
jgi:hypothetical protein